LVIGDRCNWSDRSQLLILTIHIDNGQSIFFLRDYGRSRSDAGDVWVCPVRERRRRIDVGTIARYHNLLSSSEVESRARADDTTRVRIA